MKVVVVAKAGQRYLQLACVRSRDRLIHDFIFNLCANVIKIFSSLANRTQLEHELRSATRFESENKPRFATRSQLKNWAAKSNGFINSLPFIQTCLFLGVTFIPSIGYDVANDRICLKRLDTKLNTNRPHIVFDITDLNNIRYCFFLPGTFQFGPLDQQNGPRMTPLSSSVFFAGGHHGQPGLGMTPYQNYDEFLDGIEVIDVYTLESAWPEEEWKILVGKVYDLLSNYPQENQDHTLVAVTGPLPLRTQAMTKFFDTVPLERLANLPRVLDRVSKLPDFSPATISIARSHIPILVFPISRELLGEALGRISELDLGPFHDLTPVRLLHVLQRAMSSKNRLNITSLNLSGNKLIDYTILTTVLDAFPNLKTLYLLNTPGIPMAKKLELLKGTKVSEYHDSEIYSLPFIFKSAKGGGYNWPRNDECLVSQVLYNFTRGENTSNEGVFGLNLREINLTTPFMVNGFANFIRVLSNPRTDQTHKAHSMRILAKSMAMLEIDDMIKVAPISTGLLQFRKTRRDITYLEYQKPRILPPDRWNLVIVRQAYREPPAVNDMFGVRYAFIKSEPLNETTTKTTTGQKRKASVAFNEDKEPRLLVADIDQFLEMTVIGEEKETIKEQARFIWKKCTGSLDLQVCSQEEVKEVARQANLIVATRDRQGDMSLGYFQQGGSSRS